MAMRSEPTMFARRDQINPQAGKDCAKDVYAQAGITNPREDFDCAEVYVPFSWYEPMWLENLGFCADGDGWKLTEAGATAPDGDIPWNPSGGVLSSNPIGASGMVRFGEAAQQVRGRAGDYQVERKTGRALGHAYGGGSQFFCMWVVGRPQAAELSDIAPEAVVREILALAGAMDTDGLARHLHDDVVMELPFAPPPMRRVHDGKAAVVDFQRRAACVVLVVRDDDRGRARCR